MNRRPLCMLLMSFTIMMSFVANAQQAPSQPDQVAEPGGRLLSNPSIALVKVADGFEDPVNVTNAGDGSGRLFVVERAGRIRIVDQEGNKQLPPFLDLTRHRPSAINPLGNVVQSNFIEQGLYSIAFHPEFKKNGFFFVHYASLEQNGAGVIVRFQVDLSSPNVVTPERARQTEKLILQVDQPSYNNNGGQIAFGPDGHLYAGFGDGGFKSPKEASQDLSSRLGKILRIDVNTNETYTAPANNPFAKSGASPQNEVWVKGLHNPYKFAFDQATGNLFITDVGDSSWEEINFVAASSQGGQNFGWPVMEGKECHRQPGKRKSAQCEKLGVLPAAQYGHPKKGKVLQKKGGAFACASAQGLGVANYAGMKGVYLVGDWCSGEILGLGWDGKRWQLQRLLKTPLHITAGGLDDGQRVLVLSAKFYSDDPDPKKPPFGTLWRVYAAKDVPNDAVAITAK